MRRVARLSTLAVVAACASAGGRSTASCRPVDGQLTADADVARMAGEFAVTMVATTGVAAGQTATGAFALRPQDSALVRMELPGRQQPDTPTIPFIGTADIGLERIGATRMGDLASADPQAPGVGVYVQRPSAGGPTVVVRLGSASNARGLLVFDAGHTTMYVRHIDGAGFAGGWASSTGTGFPVQESEGYFCAVRR